MAYTVFTPTNTQLFTHRITTCTHTNSLAFGNICRTEHNHAQDITAWRKIIEAVDSNEFRLHITPPPPPPPPPEGSNK